MKLANNKMFFQRKGREARGSAWLTVPKFNGVMDISVTLPTHLFLLSFLSGKSIRTYSKGQE